MLQRLLSALLQILRIQQPFRGERFDVLLVMLRETGQEEGGPLAASGKEAWYVA